MTALDVPNIILVYVNRARISHPIQTFSYALKLGIEFIILNQLVAVAARGIHRNYHTVAEKRYHYLGSFDISSFKGSKGSDPSGFGSIEVYSSSVTARDDYVQTSVPPPRILEYTRSHTATAEYLRKKRSSSIGGGSKWYPLHMKSALDTLLPRRGDARRARTSTRLCPLQ